MATHLNTNFAHGEITVTEPGTNKQVGCVAHRALGEPGHYRYEAVYSQFNGEQIQHPFYSLEAAEYWILVQYAEETELKKRGLLDTAA